MASKIIIHLFLFACFACQNSSKNIFSTNSNVKAVRINKSEFEYFCVNGCDTSSLSFIIHKGYNEKIYIDVWQSDKYKYFDVINHNSVLDTTATGGKIKNRCKKLLPISYKRTKEEFSLCLERASHFFKISEAKFIITRLSYLGHISVEVMNKLNFDKGKNLQCIHSNIASILNSTSLREDLNLILGKYGLVVDKISCQEEISLIPSEIFLERNKIPENDIVPQNIIDCEVLITLKSNIRGEGL